MGDAEGNNKEIVDIISVCKDYRPGELTLLRVNTSPSFVRYVIQTQKKNLFKMRIKRVSEHLCMCFTLAEISKYPQSIKLIICPFNFQALVFSN